MQNKKLIIGIWLLGFGIWSLGFAQGGWAGIPTKINFQGKIAPPPAQAPTITFDVSAPGKPTVNIAASDLQYDAATGIFTCTIDFKGKADILETGKADLAISVNGNNIGTQALNSVPYALRAKVAEGVTGPLAVSFSNADSPAINGINSTGWGVYGLTQSSDKAGIFGFGGAAGNGVWGRTSAVERSGIYGESTVATGYAGYFTGGKGVKVEGTVEATKFIGDGSGLTNLPAALTTTDADARYVNVTGDTMSGKLTVNVSGNNYAVHGLTNNTDQKPAVYGENPASTENPYLVETIIGVKGKAVNGRGVVGEGGDWGVVGEGGVYGISGTSKAAVYGQNLLSPATNGIAVRADSTLGYGIYALAPKNYFSSNLGIGTDAPLTKLHVKATTVGSANNTAVFEAPAAGPHASAIHWGTKGNWYIRSAANDGKVVIQDTGGNVGIGTAQPGAKLEVQGDISGGGMLVSSHIYTLSTASTSYNLLAVIPIYISPGTTTLRGKVRAKIGSLNVGTGFVRFKIGNVYSTVASVTSTTVENSPELTITGVGTGWQTLEIEGKVNTAVESVYVYSHALYVKE